MHVVHSLSQMFKVGVGRVHQQASSDVFIPQNWDSQGFAIA